MVKMPKEVEEMFGDWGAQKAVATADAEGRLNVVPVLTFSVLDEETLAFGDVFLGKTRANLEATKKVAVAAWKGSKGYQVKGSFLGFQTAGAVFEEKKAAVKEKLKLEAKSVGLIKVEEVFSVSVGPNAGKRLV